MLLWITGLQTQTHSLLALGTRNSQAQEYKAPLLHCNPPPPTQANFKFIYIATISEDLFKGKADERELKRIIVGN